MIPIDERSKVVTNRINEFSKVVSFDKDGVSIFSTPKLSGYLESVYIDPSDSVSCSLVLMTASGFPVFKTVKPVSGGLVFFFPRIQVNTTDGKTFAEGYDKFLLNDELRIEVRGGPNKQALMGIRWIGV